MTITNLELQKHLFKQSIGTLSEMAGKEAPLYLKIPRKKTFLVGVILQQAGFIITSSYR